MNILLVHPETPTTFWSFKRALRFVGKRASGIPLGLITIAAMMPDSWNQRLVDMNVSKLKRKDIKWADYVFLSGMSLHTNCMQDVIRRCNELGVKIVAGGPAVTMHMNDFAGVDHFVLNEGEITFRRFLEDLENGNPRKVYRTDEFPDLETSPIPRWELLELDKYSGVDMQYSRGCPFNCEFCSVTWLNGHDPRTKSADRFIAEVNALYEAGWRGGVFVVDDNFIGNKQKLKSTVLPALAQWSHDHDYPFHFTTEVSVNLAEDEELIKMMVEAGFDTTFIGIETPNVASLQECRKTQNLRSNLVDSVKTLHHYGLMVSGGFIVGFDNDPPTIFDDQISFIQESGIVTAMVGMLNAPIGTRLYQRMKNENRLFSEMSGNNTDGSINFTPKMDMQYLSDGYRRLVNTIYSPREFFERTKCFLNEYALPITRKRRPQWRDIRAFLRSIWFIGVIGKERRYYWKLLFHSLREYPEKFALAVRMTIYGNHFRHVAKTI